MNWLIVGLQHTAAMAWGTFWALVLGFAVSAALQTLVAPDQMSRFFGRASLRSVGLATALGAASSSCSYAAAAAARSAFKQGAALIPALAFMFASTNLVIELGAVLWVFMGWRFVLAEAVGALVLIGLMWLLMRLVFPKGLEEEARRHTQADEEEGGCCHGGADEPAGKWQALAAAFIADWRMLWKEIVIGFVIAGFLSALTPVGWWEALFLKDAPAGIRLVENALIGPLIAAATFVCSVGNIPLASVLWSRGISFGGVISFIYADLIIIPLVLIYRKHYGGRAAAYITGVLFVSMAGAGIAVDLLFAAAGLIPQGPRTSGLAEHPHFAWNYTTWLDVLAAAVFVLFLLIHRHGKRPVPTRASAGST